MSGCRILRRLLICLLLHDEIKTLCRLWLGARKNALLERIQRKKESIYRVYSVLEPDFIEF
jgi:hypothetical protein